MELGRFTARRGRAVQVRDRAGALALLPEGARQQEMAGLRARAPQGLDPEDLDTIAAAAAQQRRKLAADPVVAFLADDIEREAGTLARQSPVPPEALDESRAAAAVRLQQAAGIAAPRVFSKAALAEQVEAFLGASPDQRTGLVQALDDRFGAFAGRAKAELAGALDPLNGALVRRAVDPLAVFGIRRALAAGIRASRPLLTPTQAAFTGIH